MFFVFLSNLIEQEELLKAKASADSENKNQVES